MQRGRLMSKDSMCLKATYSHLILFSLILLISVKEEEEAGRRRGDNILFYKSFNLFPVHISQSTKLHSGAPDVSNPFTEALKLWERANKGLIPLTDGTVQGKLLSRGWRGASLANR